MKISKIDKNFAKKETKLSGKIIKVPSKYVLMHGMLYDDKNKFYRMPMNVVKKVSPALVWLNKTTAGGRIFFKTDSPFLKIHVTYPTLAYMPHMAVTGICGFTLNEVIGHKEYLCAVFKSMNIVDKHFDDEVMLKDDHKMHEYVLYFPLYNEVTSCSLEISKDAKIAPTYIYKNPLPILYYGSSITQGGCASRSDTSYQSLISKKFSVGQVNFGFSGNGKGEQVVADYLATVKCSIFVMDYDHNSPNKEELDKTHERMFLTFRKKQPETPVIIISAPNYHQDPQYYEERRQVILKTYKNALKRKDKNVYFIDGSKIYPEDLRESCSVDGCHPNDLGFYFYYLAISKIIKDNKLLK